MMRAKMYVSEVAKTQYGERVTFNAVGSGTPEDNSYAKATPDAKLEMQINNPNRRHLIRILQLMFN